MRGRVSELLGLAALIALCVAFLFGVMVPRTLHDIGPESTFTAYDFHSYFLPRFMFGAEEVAHGRWPLWNPFEYNGLPFLATAQPTALYPIKILVFALLPTRAAYWTFLVLHYLISGWGFLLFARGQKLERAAAFVGAATWVFSVGTLASNYHPNRIPNFCWIPYCFYFAHRLALWARLRDFVALSLIVGLQITSGYPEVAVDTALLVGLMLLVRPFTSAERGQPIWYAVALVIGAVALGAIIASAQTLPLVEAALEAKRSSMAQVEVIQNWFKLDLVFWPPVFMALMALSLSRRSGWLAAGETLLVAFLVGQGWMLLRRLPGFSFVRFPFAWAMVAQFPFAWAAAMGANAVLTAGESTRSQRRTIAGVTAALAAVAGAYAVWRVFKIPASRGIPEVIANQPSAALALLSAVFLVVTAIAVGRGRRAGNLMLATGIVATFSHLASYPFGHAPAAVDRPAEHGKMASLLGGSLPLAGRALCIDDIYYGYNLTDHIPSIFGIEESFLPWRYREIILHVRLLTVYHSIDWHKFLAVRGLLDALDLQYIAASPAELGAFVAHGLRPLRQIANDVLYENPSRMGTAWVNHAVRVLSSEQAVRDHVLGPDFDPHTEVVLEAPPKGHYQAAARPLVTPIKSGRRPSPTELEVEVELTRPGILVVADTAYPGWAVEVDGKPASWIRADYVLRGVELGEGAHRVRFLYRASAFHWGLALSGFGLAISAALWIWSRRARGQAS